MIRIEKITVRAGGFSLNDISMEISRGCYAALMGRTGCGKSTLLEAIAGLKSIARGKIFLADRDVTQQAPAARGIGYVPQDSALFSTLTVREQLAFALEIRHAPKNEICARVDELAGLLGIPHLFERKPRGLSGGERQRVALGRALSFRPDILLLDEPLSAVDEETRDEMYELLRRVQKETGVTVLHVTHNPQEASELADVTFLMKNGTLVREEV